MKVVIKEQKLILAPSEDQAGKAQDCRNVYLTPLDECNATKYIAALMCFKKTLSPEIMQDAVQKAITMLPIFSGIAALLYDSDSKKGG